MNLNELISLSQPERALLSVPDESCGSYRGR